MGRSKNTVHQTLQLLDTNTDELSFVCVGDTIGRETLAGETLANLANRP